MSPLSVLLLGPEIAGNTGNIIRLCSNAGCALHLIEPLGFELDDARLRRAGLDYHEYASVTTHESLDNPRVFAFSAHAKKTLPQAEFESGDALLFGSESAGLGSEVLAEFPESGQLRIPMLPQSRSLNLSNAVAVSVYEGLRQLGYPGTVA